MAEAGKCLTQSVNFRWKSARLRPPAKSCIAGAGTTQGIRSLTIDIAAIEAMIRRLLAGHETERTLGPTELAQALSSGTDWQAMLPTVRKAAVELALAGRLVIYRKGKPVDPTDFKGVWRMGLPRHD
jgi:hypothetical protein